MSKPFLFRYTRQTIQQLIAMKDSYRIDSLVGVVEEALSRTPEADFSEPERVVLAVEAMEREVNNGGYEQFFYNTPHLASSLVHALELIDCPKAAALSARAIAVLELPEKSDADTVRRVASKLSDQSSDQLDECDSRYFANDEDIAERLFEYVEAHQREIHVPHVD